MRQIKRVTALFLSLALLLTMLPGAAWAAETEELPEEAAVTEEATTETDEAQETSPESSVSGETEDDEASETEAEAADEPAAVSEEDIATVSDEVASGTCGDNLTWVLDDTGTLTISGTGAMADWDNVSSIPWYSHRESILSVTIEEGVTSIGFWAFYSHDNLANVTIGNSVTRIGTEAFHSCTSLTSITIPSNVTSIGDAAFDWCTSLTDINVDAGNTVYSSSDGVLFDKAQSTLICCPAGKIGTYMIPDSVTNIGEGAFTWCSNLTSITVPDSVTSIGSAAFYRCTSLASVTIPDGVTSIGENAFFYCTSLTSVTIPDGVTSVSNGAFAGCTSLTSITIPSGVTSIGDEAFYSCSSLTSIIIPDGVTSIGDSAFASCTGLTSITIPSSVTSIGDEAFRWCDSLTSIAIPDGVTSIGRDTFAVCDSLTSITIPASVTSIGYAAFYGCTGLTDVYYSGSKDDWDAISIDSYQNTCLTDAAIHYNSTGPDDVTVTVIASGDCGNDLNWTLDDTGTLTVSGTGAMDDSPDFCSYKSSIQTVVIEDGVTSIGSYAFCDCDKLTSVTISNSVISIGSSAFSYCDGLTGITIPDSVTYIGNSAFEECTNLKSIVIPDGVISIGDSAFLWCTSLTSVTIGSSVTSIGSNVFCYCRLTSVTIPDSVTRIGYAAFSECSRLTDITVNSGNSVYSSLDGVLFDKAQSTLVCYPGGKIGAYVIPDSVTNIGENAFSWCSSLTSITIPDSVTSIGELAFSYCYNLTDVYYDGSEAEWEAIDIGEYNGSLTNATIHYNSAVEHTHTYSTPTWAWSGTTAATATFTCIEGDDTQTVTATVTGKTTAATCTTAGKTVYTAKVTFEGETYSDTKTVTVAATGHTYTAPTWAWSEDYSKVTATFTCSVCGEQETVAATVTYKVTTAATYTAAGTGTYTATVTFNGKTYTDTKTVTIPMLVLTAPTITSLYNSTSGVSVGWDAVDGATSYIVWRLNNSTGKWEKCATTTGTTYLSTSPVSGTTYYYAIEAVNGDVTSGRGTQRYILYMATPKVSLENTTSGIKVSWNSVTGATSGYQVYRRTADTDYELLKQVSTSTTSYTDTTAEAGVRYYYIVRSVRGSARSAYASQYITRLTTPTGISVSNTKSGVQVTWSAVTGATSYQVWRKLSGSSSWSKVGTTTDTSYTSTGVTSGKTYVFTVKAVCNSSVSAYNTTGKTIMRLAEPTITLENLVGGLTASWNAVDGAEGYKLYRRSETGSYVLVATLDADELSYTDKAAAAGVVYYYRVQAYNGSYTSSWTSQFNRRIGHTTLSLAKGEDGVVLTWTKSGGCTGYYIYRMNEDGSYTRIKTITSANTLTWTDTDVDLASGNVYTYIVRGYNGSSLGSYTPKKTSDFF